MFTQTRTWSVGDIQQAILDRHYQFFRRVEVEDGQGEPGVFTIAVILHPRWEPFLDLRLVSRGAVLSSVERTVKENLPAGMALEKVEIGL